MSLKKDALELHSKNRGKLEVKSKVELKSSYDLSLAYSPGVAEPCKVIHADEDRIYDLTSKWNMVGVVSDGTAVLGLGDIGPKAALPVMEGKSILFKGFAGVDAFPICLDTKDVDEIVETVRRISPSFGGINLEDISAPRCFQIESRLKEILDIPVFHDDQHGTAVVSYAGLINSLKVVGKDLKDCKVVLNGAGAAGVAIAKLLIGVGVGDLIICDRSGSIYESRKEGMSQVKEELSKTTNREKLKGTLKHAVAGADIFIGVSVAGVLSAEMIKSMADSPIVFALANPDPEIEPAEAKRAGAAIIATGRSDYPNQVNNVLGFPGIFRGALDVRARDINEEMNIAAAHAIASLISDSELNTEYVIPNPFDNRVVEYVSSAVAKAARESGVARL
jgi:malate dehydrogenase (oxaloacetate-decarboxylating)